MTLLPRRLVEIADSLDDFSSERAMQSSVRLRHMLSAFRRIWRSMFWEIASADASSPLGCALPVMAASIRASEAVLSRAGYAFGSIKALALAKAECKRGCKLDVSASFTVDASGDMVAARPCLGDIEAVVMVVEAV